MLYTIIEEYPLYHVVHPFPSSLRLQYTVYLYTVYPPSVTKIPIPAEHVKPVISHLCTLPILTILTPCSSSQATRSVAGQVPHHPSLVVEVQASGVKGPASSPASQAQAKGTKGEVSRGRWVSTVVDGCSSSSCQRMSAPAPAAQIQHSTCSPISSFCSFYSTVHRNDHCHSHHHDPTTTTTTTTTTIAPRRSKRCGV